MRVKIGPYKDFIGPYQIAEKILFWKDKYEDDTVHKFGCWLSGDYVKEPNHLFSKLKNPSLLLRFCQWIDSKRERTIKIQLDPYDTWSAHNTLSMIIVPVLKQLKETKHGAPWTDDADVPEHLRSTSSPPKENEWDIDENHFLRWEWVMDEMIWAFEQDNIDWEEKFYSGNSDMRTEKVEGTQCLRLVDGPNNTFKVDYDAMKKHEERMNNGRLLFAKYYHGLWD
jgi:hypothetical protein